MIQLAPMTEAEFASFLERAIPRRAARYVDRGVWKEAAAIEASREFYSRTWPQGRATPHHHFCHILAGPERTRVGELWYTAECEGGLVQFWIEWIWIEPEYRRQGFATEGLRLVEEEARKLGAPRVGLYVWLDNPAALDLYKKLGYSAVSLSMGKSLDPAGGAGPPG